MRLLAVPALALAVFACTKPAAQTPHTSSSARLESETVALVQATEDGVRAYCSGVWVAQDKFLTANHCVDDVEDGGKIIYSVRGEVLAREADEVEGIHFASIVSRDEDHDLALARARLAPEHVSAGVRLPVVGEAVETMGHPLGLLWSYSSGQVTAVRIMDQGDGPIWYVQSDAPISPGNSGGGLFDGDGNVVGLCHSTAKRGELLNFYIHAQYIQAFLKGAL